MPETFTIEKNVPVPRTLNKWPFAAMDKGDSFLVGSDAAIANNCRSYALNWAKRTHNNHKFVVRKTPDGYRCWRVA